MGKIKQNESFRFKKILILIIKLVVIGLLIFFLSKKIDLDEVSVQIKNADYFYILAAIILSPVNLFFQFMRWNCALNSMVNNVARSEKIHSFFYGFGGGLITPMKVGEFIGRSIAIPSKPKSTIILATLLDKSFIMIVNNFFGVIAILFFLNRFFDFSNTFTFSLIALDVIVFLILYYFLFTGKIWENKFFDKIIISRYLKKYSKNISNLKNAKLKMISRSLVYSFLGLFVYCTQITLLLLSFNESILIINGYWIAMLLLFAISALYPVTFGGLGVREGGAVLICGYFTISASIAFSVSILIFAINVAAPAIIGIILFTKNYK